MMQRLDLGIKKVAILDIGELELAARSAKGLLVAYFGSTQITITVMALPKCSMMIPPCSMCPCMVPQTILVCCQQEEVPKSLWLCLTRESSTQITQDLRLKKDQGQALVTIAITLYRSARATTCISTRWGRPCARS